MNIPTITEVAGKDKRGNFYIVTLPNGIKGNLIFTYKGYYRGGHSHNVDESTMVLSGQLKYILPYEEKILNPGDIQHNKAGEVHLGYFMEDTWILDWQINPNNIEIITTNYPPLRKFVDEQMK